MDADSQISINKDGKDLEIVLTSGRGFFRVTEPLEEDGVLSGDIYTRMERRRVSQTGTPPVTAQPRE